VTAVNGVVTFFYNNRVIPGNNTIAQFPLTTLGPFSLHVPGLAVFDAGPVESFLTFGEGAHLDDLAVAEGEAIRETRVDPF
jgi:hypothetical protein